MNAENDTTAVPQRVRVGVDIQVAVAVAAAVLLGFTAFALTRSAGGMLTKIAIGVVLALALDGLVGRVRQRFGWSRGAAVAAVASGLFLVAGLTVLVLGPPAIRQAQSFASDLPQTVVDLYELPLVGGWLEDNDAASRVEQWVEELPMAVSTDTVTDLAETLVGGMATATIIVMITFAVLLDGERLVRLARRAIPARHRQQADRTGHVVYAIVGRYFGGSLTVAVMMGLYVLTLTLTFSVPLAPLAAVWAMICDLIPQIGGFLIGAFLAVLSLAAGPGTAVIVLVLYVIYMNIENHVIQPAIIGNAVNLSPPTTMVAALVGGAAAGVPGALVATPLVGAVKELWFEFRDPERRIDDEPVGLRRRLAAMRRRRH